MLANVQIIENCFANADERSSPWIRLNYPVSISPIHQRSIVRFVLRNYMPRNTVRNRRRGDSCGPHWVARLMRFEGVRSQTRYRRRLGKSGGQPAVASPNLLKRQFDVRESNKVCVTDITYIRTYEGWLHVAVVLDLFSRQVVGWSIKPQMTSDLGECLENPGRIINRCL